MARLRRIRNYRTSGWKVCLKKIDIKDLGIQDGDLIDLEDCVVHSELHAQIKKEEKENECTRGN
jgi:hypothetical protein